MDSSKLIDKLKKLFAMADPANGATDNEMKAAMAAAQRLMTEHGISEAQVLTSQAQTVDVLEETMDLKRREWYSDTSILQIILQMLPVRAVLRPYSQRLDSGAYDKYLSVVFVGQEAQIAVAMLFFAKLRQAFLTGTKRYIKLHKLRWSASIQRGYDLGLRQGFLQANAEAKAAAEASAGPSYALMVRNTEQALDQYIARRFQLTARKAKTTSVDNNAYLQGHQDGRHLSLREKLAQE